MKLSAKSAAILKAIASGCTYEQILKQDSSLRYTDIFKAAAEALRMTDEPPSGQAYAERMAEILLSASGLIPRGRRLRMTSCGSWLQLGSGLKKLRNSCNANPPPL